jgi:heat shock protein HslJ
MKKYGLILLLATFAVASCDTATIPSTVSEVQGQWELQAFELNNGSTVTIPNPEKFTARFDADDTVNLTVDCNRCRGSYEAEGNSLTLGLMACTLAYCGDDSLDSDYMAALGSVSNYARHGQELLIDYADGTMRFSLGTVTG